MGMKNGYRSFKVQYIRGVSDRVRISGENSPSDERGTRTVPAGNHTIVADFERRKTKTYFN